MRPGSGSDDEYAAFARGYDLLTGPPLRGLRREMVRAVLTGRAGDGVFLDVCCGTGAQVELLIRAGVVCLGADLSPSMLARAGRRGLPVVRADAGRLPFADDVFPALGLTLALHEKPHPVRLAILAEMRRVLAPHGRMFIADYAPAPSGAGPALIRRIIATVERAAGAEHHRLYRDFLSRGGLPGVLAAAGLEILTAQGLAGGNLSFVQCR